MFNSVPGIEEDLNRLKRWTSCTPLVKPVREGQRTTRACARSPRRAGPWPWPWPRPRRGAARPAGRCACACVCACAAERDVQVRCGVARCDVMAILQLTAINRAIKRAIKSVINGHNRITYMTLMVSRFNDPEHLSHYIRSAIPLIHSAPEH